MSMFLRAWVNYGAECADFAGGRMIHAYLFVVGGKHVRGDDPSGHGFGFRKFFHPYSIAKHQADLHPQ